MPKPFDKLREQLLRAGIAPRHIRRYLAELTDHLADLRAEEEHAGAPYAKPKPPPSTASAPSITSPPP